MHVNKLTVFHLCDLPCQMSGVDLSPSMIRSLIKKLSNEVAGINHRLSASEWADLAEQCAPHDLGTHRNVVF